MKVPTRVAVVVAAAALLTAAALVTDAAAVTNTVARGYDVSYPQCGGGLPADPGFGIVGVNGGRPWDHNPCLASQYAWAAGAPGAPAFYANSANPGTLSVRWTYPGPRSCGGANDDLGCAYNYGWNSAGDAIAYAQQQTGAAGAWQWWVDVETGNTWSSNTTSNVEVLRGMRDRLVAQGVAVGFYSTGYQWGVITGGTKAFAAHPSWLAGAKNYNDARRRCGRANAFTGSYVAVVQFVAGGFDNDVRC